ncbi:MAG TPA: tRNA (adenosine(37)-N6)-threonylcarbamoyltransferase complex ATPase subunit type 1 TsaE [Bacteroidales bacterium]|nr:tRNA (adenosine(37)-N6)-threonylcarbamoyltransferase complex ATPase subunit type 1 TsaE [Bacteroidales bacterium]HPB24806.1 tRNA (adenosine(37)-N6)-threonylcarbamoyltransferase complex ATPase subunit type 1 TsaE [Bacteroidales bacterium]HPI31558.1 tRNA (adenosine(37)-N6)-threonylcarbamoyltransferase complex ATPase subunit type 1 TsaE [Bacteroidales bacterium]HQN15663.1 tRNA (adenosine(37)-N6)-threonylcarbamoyltransferase complex ATPase subunit type 1 TsaE [Bacteroidales bacterium]HQP15180.1 
MNQQIICNHLDELPGIAKKILAAFPSSRIFTFTGDLGAGKTTLIKEMCKLLNVTGLTNSPSFSLVNEYPSSSGDMIYHFDFYRIKNISEIFDIGYEEYFYSGHYCFIEWPEIARQLLPEDHVEVTIETAKDQSSRIITFSSQI